MYNLIIDVVNKIEFIELLGSLAYDQIKSYVSDLHKITDRHETKLYSMLIMANRLDPLSQNNLPHFQEAIEIALSWADKIAVVNGNRTLTLIQMKRIESEARKLVNTDIKIMRYKSKNDALKYILSK